ncbi:unnamed protein product [Lactuca virosa]|uniref:Uncharacterized protein n=1 Tax=Lactuca virosa TaxID=75947 RepID=A0AAU9LRP8_9ASTR|nr:unnamed protein product [Lactuca virosa]
MSTRWSLCDSWEIARRCRGKKYRDNTDPGGDHGGRGRCLRRTSPARNDEVQIIGGTAEGLGLQRQNRASTGDTNRPSSSLPPAVASPAVSPHCDDSVFPLKMIQVCLGKDSSAVEKI